VHSNDKTELDAIANRLWDKFEISDYIALREASERADFFPWVFFEVLPPNHEQFAVETYEEMESIGLTGNLYPRIVAGDVFAVDQLAFEILKFLNHRHQNVKSVANSDLKKGNALVDFLVCLMLEATAKYKLQFVAPLMVLIQHKLKLRENRIISNVENRARKQSAAGIYYASLEKGIKLTDRELADRVGLNQSTISRYKEDPDFQAWGEAFLASCKIDGFDASNLKVPPKKK